MYSFEELINYPKSKKWALRCKIRNIYLIILLIVFVFSLIFKDDLLLNIDWTYKVIFVCVSLLLLYTGGYKEIPSNVEFEFYDDYMIVHKEKIAYNPPKERKELTKCYYSDIKNIEYRKDTKQLSIKAKHEDTYYNYKDNILEEKPSCHKTVNSIICIYPDEKYAVDLIIAIEKNTGVKIDVKRG